MRSRRPQNGRPRMPESAEGSSTHGRRKQHDERLGRLRGRVFPARDGSGTHRKAIGGPWLRRLAILPRGLTVTRRPRPPRWQDFAPGKDGLEYARDPPAKATKKRKRSRPPARRIDQQTTWRPENGHEALSRPRTLRFSSFPQCPREGGPDPPIHPRPFDRSPVCARSGRFTKNCARRGVNTTGSALNLRPATSPTRIGKMPISFFRRRRTAGAATNPTPEQEIALDDIGKALACM